MSVLESRGCLHVYSDDAPLLTTYALLWLEGRDEVILILWIKLNVEGKDVRVNSEKNERVQKLWWGLQICSPTLPFCLKYLWRILNTLTWVGELGYLSLAKNIYVCIYFKIWSSPTLGHVFIFDTSSRFKYVTTLNSCIRNGGRNYIYVLIHSF